MALYGNRRPNPILALSITWLPALDLQLIRASTPEQKYPAFYATIRYALGAGAGNLIYQF
jgi:hypothetical protein